MESFPSTKFGTNNYKMNIRIPDLEKPIIDELSKQVIEAVEGRLDSLFETKNYDRWFSILQAAEYAGVSKSTIDREVADNHLKAYKFRGSIKIKKSDLDACFKPYGDDSGHS